MTIDEELDEILRLELKQREQYLDSEKNWRRQNHTSYNDECTIEDDKDLRRFKKIKLL